MTSLTGTNVVGVGSLPHTATSNANRSTVLPNYPVQGARLQPNNCSVPSWCIWNCRIHLQLSDNRLLDRCLGTPKDVDYWSGWCLLLGDLLRHHASGIQWLKQHCRKGLHDCRNLHLLRDIL